MTRIILIIALTLSILATPAHADAPPGNGDTVVCGQEGVCDAPVVVKIWLPMVDKGG